MSQELFFAALASMTIVGAGAVYAYALLNVTHPRARAVMTLGLTLIPWYALRPVRGRHEAPWGSTSEWLSDTWEGIQKAAGAPGVAVAQWWDRSTVQTRTRPLILGMDPAYPDAPIVAVAHDGTVHTSTLDERPRVYHGGPPQDPSNWAVPGEWQHPSLLAVSNWQEPTPEWLDQASDRLRTALAEGRVFALPEDATLVFDTTPLDVRAAEIRAHEENETFVPPVVVPERTDAGATEDWSPVAEVGTDELTVALVHTEPDDEELAILAAFDTLVEESRKVADWELDWARDVDAYLAAAGVKSDAHQRWRAGQLDFPTSELPRVLLDR